MSINSTQLAALPPEYLAEDISGTLMGVAILFLVLQTIIFILYYTTQYIHRTHRGVETWFLIPFSFTTCTAQCINGLLLIAIAGAGKHLARNLLEDPGRVINYMKLLKFAELCHIISIATPKLAILGLYMRIFTTKNYRIAAKMTGLIVILNFIAGFILVFTACRPFAYNWNKTIPGGKCFDIMEAYRALTIPNLVTDFVMAVMPMPSLWKLHVQLHVKIGLFFTFLIGSVGIVTSIVRTVQLFTLDFYIDATYSGIQLFVWTIVEPGTYFMAACIPSLKPLKRKIFKDKGLASTIITKFRSTPSKLSRGSAEKDSKLSNHIYKQRTVDVHSAKVSKDEQSSMNSTSGFNLQGNGYIELDDLQDTRHGDIAYSVSRV